MEFLDDEVQIIDQEIEAKSSEMENRKMTFLDDEVLSTDEENTNTAIKIFGTMSLEDLQENKGTRYIQSDNMRQIRVLPKHLTFQKQVEKDTSPVALEEVVCAKCNTSMLRKFFGRHNRLYHTGLAWIEGEESIDMNNEKLLMKILNNVLKLSKLLICEVCGTTRKSSTGFIGHLKYCQKLKDMNNEKLLMKILNNVLKLSKLLICEVCGTTRKSSTGFIGHLKYCQKLKVLKKSWNQRVSCDICGRKMLKANLKRHKKTMHEESKESKLEENIICATDNCTPKRNAAIRALRKIWDCIDQETTEQESLTEHSTAEYSAGDPDSDGSCYEAGSDENSDTSSVEEYTTYEPKKKKMEQFRHCLTTYREFLKSAVNQRLQYYDRNYEQYLFPTLHTTSDDWVLLNSYEAEYYLPETKESISFTLNFHKDGMQDLRTDLSDNLEKLKLFEGNILHGQPIFFAGGPVWSLAWCPLPLSLTMQSDVQIPQYLALSCHQSTEDKFSRGKSFKHRSLIQIWTFGHLDNQSTCTKAPVFEMGIAHDYGTVWCLAWCPSGCYDVHIRKDGFLPRIGLLAMACSDGTVRLYSVCQPSGLKTDQLRIFKPMPVCTLMLDYSKDQKYGTKGYQCLRLSWFTGKGHREIAGGFTNGFIAVWNIEVKSSQMPYYTVYPYKVIHAHLEPVTVVAFVPTTKPRFLMTGSVDQHIKFWDLEEQLPLASTKQHSNITSGAWLANTKAAVFGYEADMSFQHHHSSLLCFRRGFESFHILPQNSTAWSTSANDWINAVAQSTDKGELKMSLLMQDINRTMGDKTMMLSCIGLIDMNKSTVGDLNGGSQDLSKEGAQNLIESDILIDIDEIGIKKEEHCLILTIKRGNQTCELAFHNNETLDSKAENCSFHSSDDKKPLINNISLDAEAAMYKSKTNEHNNEDNDHVNAVMNDSGVLTDDASSEYDIRSPDAVTYELAKSKYGLIFIDFPVESFCQESGVKDLLMGQTKLMPKLAPNTYPILSLNQVSWNPNCHSCFWLAVGYQCGITRVLCLKEIYPHWTNILKNRNES